MSRYPISTPSIDWYTRFFGRPPDHRVGDEVLWEIDEHATLFIEPNAAQAGAGRITLAVAGLDALLERLAAQRIEHEPIETYSNGVRHVNVPDPDREHDRVRRAARRRERVTSIGRKPPQFGQASRSRKRPRLLGAVLTGYPARTMGVAPGAKPV